MGQTKTNKELFELVEVMKWDHETLVDQITIMKNRNTQLEKMAEEKSSMFEDLKLTAEKAEHKYFTIKQQYDTLMHESQVVQNQLTLLNDKYENETLEREDAVNTNKRAENELVLLKQHLDNYKN